MTLIAVLASAAALPVLAACTYLAVLTLLARGRPRGRPIPTVPPTRFVVVVPAHDEEAGLPRTLASLAALRWPTACRRVLVVADNCTDRTAEVAARGGAQVLVRVDPLRRGKGFALAAAFDRLLDEPTTWDAVLVIDADSDASPNLLAVAHERLVAGDDALQATYLPRRGDAPLQQITAVALWAMHVVRGRARERLGLSVGLRGNGMVFHRAALERVPYRSFSAVEDLEHGIRLALAGIRVGHLDEAMVRGDMPADAAVGAVQRTRWIGGRGALLRDLLPQLLRAARARRSGMLADLAAELVVPPLSLLATLTAGGLGVAACLVPHGVVLPLLLWGAAAVALVVHVGDAAVAVLPLRAATRLLSAIPGYALRKAALTVRTFIHPTRTWVRTARPGAL